MAGKDTPRIESKQTGPITPEQKKKAAKKAKRAAMANQPRKKGQLKEYFKGVKLETKKVVWPTRKELVSYTVVVLVACTFFSLVIWGVDSAFLAGLGKLLGISI
jgi:preprotein translocase subunit SecE